MRKIVLGLIVAANLMACSKPRTTTNLYWRNTPWNTKIDSNFTLLNQTELLSIYSRIKESLCIGEVSIDSVRYTVFDGRIMIVRLYYDSVATGRTLNEYFKVAYKSMAGDEYIDNNGAYFSDCPLSDNKHSLDMKEYGYALFTTTYMNDIWSDNGNQWRRPFVKKWKPYYVMYVNNFLYAEYEHSLERQDVVVDSIKNEHIKAALRNCPIN